MLLCSVDLLYYSLVGLALYHFAGRYIYSQFLSNWLFWFCQGPWYIGQFTDGHFGAAFLWGTLVRGTYQPPDIQTVIGTIQVERSNLSNLNYHSILFQFLLFLFPYTFCLCSSCFYRYTRLQSNRNLNESASDRSVRILTVYIIFGYTILFLLFWSYLTTASVKFGWILSPFGLTLSIFASFLYIRSCRLVIGHFRLPPPKSYTKAQRSKILTCEDRTLLSTAQMQATTNTDESKEDQ